jgi:hypothetical protein
LELKMARSAADRKAEAAVYRLRSEAASQRAASSQFVIGDTVRWTSAAGTKTGTIKNIHLGLAADNKLHPWMTIEFATPRGTSTVTIEASEGNLAGLKVEKIVQDTITVKNLMTGKDVTIAADTPWCCNPASETFWSM